MTLGKAIGKLRNEKGLTQAQLAAAVGIHRQHLHRLEKGDFQPRQQTLEKAALATFLRALITCRQIEKLMLGKAS